MANRLALEKSPYLLQHAANPVDWHPWSDDAFDEARKQDKPVFLSIGYSTCHWCHVMEHESFEDADVARLMNETFVNIKVDREERPDIDGVYMAVCQILTGSGGWPLTIIITPDKKPFFAGTYIPKHSSYGRTGMLDLIPRIRQIWQGQRKQVAESADQIVAALRESVTPTSRRAPPATQDSGLSTQHSPPSTQDSVLSTQDSSLGPAILDKAWQQLAEHYDPVYGGFGSAPKFPTAHDLLFLLRYWKRTGHEQALPMVEKTLQAIRRGGIYDQIGFGVHRYSTDQEWLVPHFEKMLYDQALLAMACTETHQATRKPLYARIAREIFTYVLRDITDPSGGFYCAEDADSEGIEGKFYVWTAQEIRRVLSGRDADLFIDTYNIRQAGNYRQEVPGGHRAATTPGANIPYLTDPTAPQDRLIVTIEDPGDLEILESARQKLFTGRQSRVHPGKDDKVLTDWNGLMIAALAQASAALDEPHYADAARRAAGFVMRHLRLPTGRLLHRYRQGEVSIAASLDDYAFFIWGLIELYEATFDADHLQTALQLTDDVIRHYWDDAGGGFFFTADDGEDILIRSKPAYDGAVPSGNSVMMLNLLRLARLTGRTEYEDRATQAGQAFADQVAQAPLAHMQMLTAIDLATGPSFEIVVTGPSQAESTRNMLATLARTYLPSTVVLFRATDQTSPPITQIAPFTAYQTGGGNKATAYVCRHFQCQLPTTDIHQMMDMLQSSTH